MSTTSLEPSEIQALEGWNRLTPYHKRAAHVLYSNAGSFLDSVGVQNAVFLTLTFPADVTTPKEASRRFDSLRSHVLNRIFPDGMIRVMEPHKDGRPHFHLLAGAGVDVRTGTDMEGLRRGGRYRANAANENLRSIIKELIVRCRRYGFGVFLAEPVKSNREAVTRYVGKYISKGVTGRPEAWKGVRLVEYDRKKKTASVRFAWNTEKARLWREKVKALAGAVGCRDLEELGSALGRRWAFRHQRVIERIKIDHWSEQAKEADNPPSIRDTRLCLSLMAQGRKLWLTPQEAAIEIGLINHGHTWPAVEPYISMMQGREPPSVPLSQAELSL
jgi:hypothetical protein